jgi:very-short-patch-repair endonuclease
MITMVTDGKNMRALSGKTYEQRYNVAASRARDRLYLFRSFARDQVSEKDLRAKLLDHFAHPLEQDSVRVEQLRDLCESNFERAVYDALTRQGFRTTPQVHAGAYRIDLVVEGTEDRRLAIELDGDQYHTPERWAHDIARQRVLERVGWRFWRCWGSSYLADPEGSLADLFSTLAEHGIEPLGSAGADISKITEYREVVPSIGSSETEMDDKTADLADTELEETLKTEEVEDERRGGSVLPFSHKTGSASS